MNRIPFRTRRAVAALPAVLAASLVLSSCAAPGGTAPAPPAAGPEEARADAKGAPPAGAGVPSSLGEMPEAVALLETLTEEVDRAVAADDAERKAAEQLDSALRRVEKIRHRQEEVPFDELLEISRRLATTRRAVRDAGKTIGSRLARIEESSRRVRELEATFEALATLAAEPGVPPEIRLRAGICRAQLEDLAKRLSGKRTAILALVDRLSEARGAVAATNAATELRLADSELRLAEGVEEPVWSLGMGSEEQWTRVGARLARDARRVRGWFRSNIVAVLLLTAVFLGGTVALLHHLKPWAERRAAADPAAAASLRFMESPWAAGLPVAVLAIVLFSPAAPAIVYEVAWLPAAPAVAWIVVRVLGPGVRRIVWVLTLSLALTPFAAALREVPLADRLFTLLQTLPLAVVLGIDLFRSRRSGLVEEDRSMARLRPVGWFLAGCLAVASLAVVVGQVGVAYFLGRGALGTLRGTVLVIAAYLVVSGLLRGVLASKPAQALLMVRGHADLVAETCLRALRILGILGVLTVSVGAFGIGSWLESLLMRVLQAEAKVGAVTLSPASAIGFALVLWLSTLAARLIGFLLAEEILPRLDLRRGTAVAISGTTRYLVLLGGVVLAAGVAGIDVTKFGFLAGALGVGVGLGLQNVVGNFVSGLILLFERPFQVGDAVDVSGDAGTVTRIGIRSSTVRTFDGADVIVPNADLISKSVVNWTGASPHRRFDVSVGVAYGSQAEATARALLDAARRTAGVLRDPAPGAYFERFGESSLDWVLRVWVRMDESPEVLSGLRQAVSEELGKVGLEVPFPQRDLNIRSVAPGSPGLAGA